MSTPLQVKVSRDGKEIGTYEAQEAVRLLVSGTLKETDFYWHEGMTNWAPLTLFLASEIKRIEGVRAKEGEDRAVAEAVRIRLEKEKASRYHCHCCRKSFVEPINGLGLGSFVVMILGVLFVIAGFVFDGRNAHLLGILGIAMYWGPAIRSRLPSLCPNCRSSNFSRP